MPPFSSFLTQTSTTSTIPMSLLPSSSSSQQLSNESFSLGWLAGDEPSSVSRHRSSTSDAYDFDFGLVSSPPLSPALVHADQIFSNGFLLPLRVAVDRSKSESTSESGSCSSTSSATLSRSLSLDSSESYLSFSNRYNQLQQHSRNAAAAAAAKTASASPSGRGASKNYKLPFLPSRARKYLCFLFPWSRKACGRRGSVTKRTPPTGGDESSRVRLCRNNSYESTAIDDAILHCKKSVAST